ncbi:hypothetical protein [Bradyrhizobium sp. CCBAU 45384]|uniref:hypothetical protein n=1 Tax=Bradyrhizobium sp. CCBAU 45384 TaxID=858428 RepID=UPI00230667FB|nr:hypothetical protein [Bradyrhizobium sp. CCBAU 45384]MDA9411882.1 hypothetical protein [Bradyrhizobium sp. CCBAU 45384]
MSVGTADTDNPLGPRERQRALDLDERRRARQVGVWARRQVASPGAPRMSMGIMNSLAGLNVDELGHLLRASSAAIIKLIAGVVSGGRIDGVRSVQPLQQWLLLFSKVLSPGEDLPDCAEGDSGPKWRFG